MPFWSFLKWEEKGCVFGPSLSGVVVLSIEAHRDMF